MAEKPLRAWLLPASKQQVLYKVHWLSKFNSRQDLTRQWQRPDTWERRRWAKKFVCKLWHRYQLAASIRLWLSSFASLTPPLGGVSRLLAALWHWEKKWKIQRMSVPFCLRWSSGGAPPSTVQCTALNTQKWKYRIFYSSFVAHVPRWPLLQERTVRRPRRYLRYFVSTFSGICY